MAQPSHSSIASLTLQLIVLIARQESFQLKVVSLQEQIISIQYQVQSLAHGQQNLISLVQSARDYVNQLTQNQVLTTNNLTYGLDSYDPSAHVYESVD